jgi:hypothetical protein
MLNLLNVNSHVQIVYKVNKSTIRIKLYYNWNRYNTNIIDCTFN